MRLFEATKVCVLILSIAFCLPGQSTPSKDTQTETKGMPPRATPADYQAHAQAGTTTIAAEFTGHSLPTLEGPLSSEDYVAVETALFGPPGAQIRISAADFSLRVNGKKTVPSQPLELVAPSIRDPEWVPPEAAEKKSKSSMAGTGGQRDEDRNLPPAPVKIPIAMQRAMAQRVQRAALPEGDRALPQAGLIFFPYRSKEKNIQSVELLYDGPAGKATLKLQ
jgi:hypothetical protein